MFARASAVSLTLLILTACSSCVPWDMLMRATSILGFYHAFRTPGLSVDGPKVQTIFVLRTPCPPLSLSSITLLGIRTGYRPVLVHIPESKVATRYISSSMGFLLKPPSSISNKHSLFPERPLSSRYPHESRLPQLGYRTWFQAAYPLQSGFRLFEYG